MPESTNTAPWRWAQIGNQIGAYGAFFTGIGVMASAFTDNDYIKIPTVTIFILCSALGIFSYRKRITAGEFNQRGPSPALSNTYYNMPETPPPSPDINAASDTDGESDEEDNSEFEILVQPVIS